MQWFPKAGASKKGSASDVFALSSTDGEYVTAPAHFNCLLHQLNAIGWYNDI